MASPLDAWENFYIIVASSAGALTGLQFVVITLVAEIRPVSGSGAPEIAAFGTPNVVHFCAVLLLGAILSAPWTGLSGVVLAIGAMGLAGVVYVAIVIRRAGNQKSYTPDRGDWAWHAVLPLLAYSALVVAGAALRRNTEAALFTIGGASLLLLFVGIHNAWDTVTYVTVGAGNPGKRPSEEPRAAAQPQAPEQPQATRPPVKGT